MNRLNCVHSGLSFGFELHGRLLDCHLNWSEVTVKRCATDDRRTHRVLYIWPHVLIATLFIWVVNKAGILLHKHSANTRVTIIEAQAMLVRRRSWYAHSILFSFIFLYRDFLQTIDLIMLDEMWYLIFDIMFDFVWRAVTSLLVLFLLCQLVKRDGPDINGLF